MQPYAADGATETNEQRPWRATLSLLGSILDDQALKPRNVRHCQNIEPFGLTVSFTIDTAVGLDTQIANAIG